MIRAYVYAAVVLGSPEIVLSVVGGTVTLDSTRAPHVQADIRVTRPVASTLTRLDPRRSPAPRVRVTVSEGGALVRTFDLNVRDLDSSQGGDELTVTAHSDEALAADYSPLTPQTGLWGLGLTVKPLVDWVLSNIPGIRKNWVTWLPQIGGGESGTGSAPESGRSSSPWGVSPGTGAAVNTDPNHMRINDARLPKPSMSAYQATWTTPPTGGSISFNSGIFPVPAGESTASIYLADNIPNSRWRAFIRWLNASGGIVSTSTGPYVNYEDASNRWQVTATRPAGATQAYVGIALTSATLITGVQTAWVTGAQFETGNTMTSYIDSVLDYSTVDAVIGSYWPLTNLIVNPSFEGLLNTTGWEIHSGVSTLGTSTNIDIPNTNGARLEGNDCARFIVSGSSGYIRTTPMSVTPGHWYNFRASVGATSTLASVNTHMRFLDAGGNQIRNYSNSYGTYNYWSSVGLDGKAPEGAASAIIIIGLTGASPGMAGYLDCAIFAEDVENNVPGKESFGYFSGATPATADYTYAWSGDANVSTSTRTPINERSPGVLVWEPGTSAMDFLAPVLQSVGLRLVCDGDRRWTLRNEGYQAPGGQAIRYGVNMVAGRDVLHRDEWFDAAVTRYRWRNAYGEEKTRDDRYGASSATRTRLIEKDAVWPGRGFSEYAVRRAKQRGRLITVTAVSDFTIVAEQDISVGLEAVAPQTGLVESVVFNLGQDEMNVTTRSGDVRAGSIDALTGIINALTGTINNL